MRWLALLWVLPNVAFAADGQTDFGIQGGGRVETHLRLSTTQCEANAFWDCGFLDFADTAVASGWVEGRVGEHVRANIDADLRLHPPRQINTLEDASQPDAVWVSFRLNKGYIDLRGVGFKGFDLRLGAQKVGWGVADGFSVVDNVNPYDLQDPLDLSGRLAVPMTSAWLHHKQVSFQVVMVPFFFPSALPLEGLQVEPNSADLLQDDAFSDVSVGSIEYRVTVPPPSLANVQLGARFWWSAPFADFAVSYFRGRDSLPQADGELVLTGFQTQQNRVDVAVDLVYPRVDVFGFEARGGLFWDIAGWVEFSATLPQTTTVTSRESQLLDLERLGTIDAVPNPLPSVETQDGEPIFRVIAGLERPFGPVTINLQYMRGLMLERRDQDLRHYAVGAVRITATDSLVFDVRAVTDFSGWLATAEMRHLFADAVELSFGGAWGGGPDESTLSLLKGVSQIHLGAAVQF